MVIYKKDDQNQTCMDHLTSYGVDGFTHKRCDVVCNSGYAIQYYSINVV